MRVLTIAGNPPSEEPGKLEKRALEAKSKQLSAGEEAVLLERIRNGDKTVIDKLIDSREAGILSVIKPFLYEGPPDVEEMLETGKNALRKLAEGEVCSIGREIFFRFEAWVVRQAILKKKQEKMKNK